MTGQQLRAQREAAGLTQAELAARIGVRAEAVSRWETGVRGLRRTSIVALESVLGKDQGTVKAEASRK